VSVRPLERDELDAVVATLRARPAEKHVDRFAQQGRGDLVYFMAWDGELPVGHAILRRRGRSGYPQLEDLWVVPARRGVGIGTALLEAVERAAADERAEALGLAVAVENEGARRLYRRHGYVQTEQPPFLLTYTAFGDDGVPTPVNELSLYLMKRL
jgi:ribosomal protein S18 acetylase RimI-like enzyme